MKDLEDIRWDILDEIDECEDKLKILKEELREVESDIRKQNN